MPENDQADNKGPVAVSINLGQEIDRSLADILRALLLPSATEIGGFLGDTIGIYSDRVRRKRELNARAGMDEVNKQLERANVDVSTIVPPKEEELHLLMTGLSLTDDDYVRRLWAGLFAKAISPDAAVTAERSYIVVLQSLSPQDAKIIDFLAFVMETEAALKSAPRAPLPNDLSKPTPDEASVQEEFHKRSAERTITAIRAIRQRAAEYGVDRLVGEEWSANLRRQGVIDHAPLRLPRVGDLRLRGNHERDFLELADKVMTKIGNLEELSKRARTSPPSLMLDSHPNQPVMLNVVLTPFGQRLAHACGLLGSPSELRAAGR